MVLYTVFDAQTGIVVRAGRASNEPLALLQKGDDEVLLGAMADREAQMVVDGALAYRPTITDLATVPAGTRVFVDGVEHGICDDGAVEIETGIPGTYRVRLVPPFPYQPFEIDVVIP